TDHANYTPLGSGTAAGSNWTLTGLNLPMTQNFYVRARGYYRSGYQNGSGSMVESVRNAFVLPANCARFLENFDGVTAPALPVGWVAANAAGPPPLWITSPTSPDTMPNDAFVDDPAVISD